MLLLETMLPLALIAAMPLIRTYIKIKYPTPRALGQILLKLCVVSADEILTYNELLEQECRLNPHSRWTLRKNQIRINHSYLGQMAWNTSLFQQVLRFEAIKIDTDNSGDHEPRERLILDLSNDAAQLRYEVAKANSDLLLRALLCLVANQQSLMTLLKKYKKLEQDFVALADMAPDTGYRDMLIEGLGLTNWGIIGGGGSAPDTA